MAKYVYPAVFTREDCGGYSIHFPDIAGCFTQGEDMEDGLDMANDALCLMLYHMEEKSANIPLPSDPLGIEVGDNAFVSLVACDTLDYKRFYDNKAVKKTLTIPAWLNTMAIQHEINFSQVLQAALKEQLQVGNR
ncbi:MAG: type II toxin-antitoxin system HicB family antitoxin [Lachnospiraceae bacterium]|jgi:predicted RNase H-like HicB family nuclease|nr:type II toxin-antitoxin system HicB family antitoxin [Lachnospiraceae bacterium]